MTDSLPAAIDPLAEAADLLGRISESPVVSVYVTLAGTDEASRRANQIQLKNACAQLRAANADELRPDIAESICARFESLPTDDESWDLHGESVAMALSESNFHRQTLPYKVANRLVIDDRFFVLPMLRLSHQSQVIAVLDLDRERANLLIVNGRGIETIQLSDRGMAGQQPEEDRRDAQLQQHSAGRQGASLETVIHGQGSSERTDDERLRRWMSEAADKVVAQIGDRGIPMIVACDDNMFGAYKAANRYAKFLDDRHIAPATRDGLPPSAVEALRAISRAMVDRRVEELTSHVAAAVANEQGSADLDEIAEAAWQGRVDTLLVLDDFDDETAVEQSPAEGISSEIRRINVAASDAIQTGATVVVVPPHAIFADGRRIVAAYRF